jgi:hypothetical protein
MGVLAHQGGWDEILIPALFVLALIGIPAIRDRRRGRAPSAPAARSSSCPYCDAPLGSRDARCPRCGFRVPARGR